MKPTGRIYLYPGAGPGGRNVFPVGTFEDLQDENITPTDGMLIHFWCGDGDDEGNDAPLLFEGTVHYDGRQQHWYALIDEETFRH